MQYIITGSLGNISRPLVSELAQAGHEVTVISSNMDRSTEIAALRAKAAIGSVNDGGFLKEAFSHADAAYLMIPPNFAVSDFPAYQRQVADNYVAALRDSSIRHVVLLSSIGAHLRKGAGPIDGLGYLEEQLQALGTVHVKALRPGYFFYNLFTMKEMILSHNMMGGNFNNPNEKIVMVHHEDIASAAVRYLMNPDFEGFSTEYVASDERYASEIASVAGKALGKEHLPWIDFTDEQARAGMLQSGLNPSLVESYITMGKAFREGRIQEDYWRNPPVGMGRYKLEDYVGDLVRAFGYKPA